MNSATEQANCCEIVNTSGCGDSLVGGVVHTVQLSQYFGMVMVHALCSGQSLLDAVGLRGAEHVILTV